MLNTEDRCTRCNGSGRLTVERKDGTTWRVECQACGGCGSKHAGISRDELRRLNYDNHPRRQDRCRLGW